MLASGTLHAHSSLCPPPQNNSYSMQYQLSQLSNNAVPVRVDCIGHSLGGGIATLCGVWASETWPQADVRVVTFGSPKVGNSDFAQGVLAVVGRTYRVVNELDEVGVVVGVVLLACVRLCVCACVCVRACACV